MLKNITYWLEYWVEKPAKWYHFWMPRSGLPGGLIFGTIIGLTLAAIL